MKQHYIRILLVLFSASFFLTILLVSNADHEQNFINNQKREQTQTITPTPTPSPDPLDPKTALLLGYGGGNHDGGSLTDTLLLAQIRPKQKTILLVSIPRDLAVEIPVTEQTIQTMKINAAYAIGLDHKQYPNKPAQYLDTNGGKNLAKDTLTKVTGIHIDHVLAVSFAGFTKALDLLGPLSVSVPQSFTDTYYPLEGKETETCGRSEEDIRNLTATMSGFDLEKQFPCRYETLTFTRGKQKMTAEDALKFVRSRHSDTAGGDFNRSKRQAALLTALKEKLTSPEIIPKLLPLAKTVYGSIDTDVSPSDIPSFLALYNDINSYTVTSVSLSTDNILTEYISPQGQYLLSVKPGYSIQQFLNETIASSSALPASAASTSPAAAR